jgi:CBS domain-containing protein
VAPDESVFVAARLMLEKKISGLPVADDSGKLVGVVTEGDFLRVLKPPQSANGRDGSSSFWDLAGLRKSTFSLAAGRFVTS